MVLTQYTDNPVADAEAYSSALENQPHITCCLCGAKLYIGDTVYLIDGDPYCTDCVTRREVDLDDIQ